MATGGPWGLPWGGVVGTKTGLGKPWGHRACCPHPSPPHAHPLSPRPAPPCPQSHRCWTKGTRAVCGISPRGDYVGFPNRCYYACTNQASGDRWDIAFWYNVSGLLSPAPPCCRPARPPAHRLPPGRAMPLTCPPLPLPPPDAASPLVQVRGVGLEVPGAVHEPLVNASGLDSAPRAAALAFAGQRSQRGLGRQPPRNACLPLAASSVSSPRSNFEPSIPPSRPTAAHLCPPSVCTLDPVSHALLDGPPARHSGWQACTPAPRRHVWRGPPCTCMPTLSHPPSPLGPRRDPRPELNSHPGSCERGAQPCAVGPGCNMLCPSPSML